LSDIARDDRADPLGFAVVRILEKWQGAASGSPSANSVIDRKRPESLSPVGPGTIPPRWRNKLSSFKFKDALLFDADFLKTWGDEPWNPNEADRKAAAELHVQLVSRITTQGLDYTAGVETAALTSLRAFFEAARAITSKHLGCRIVDTLGWYVINTHVRPFTAKWHPQSERGALAALDATDVFRAELIVLQRALSCFDDLLIEIRDDRAPPTRRPGSQSAREKGIVDEMVKPLRWGIVKLTREAKDPMVEKINDAERTAIKARRDHYKNTPETNQQTEQQPAQGQQPDGTSGAPKDREYAVGLALSGGGIRSATFSLGVLVALARRNLLHQFDYLSTVSGGGYLGAFLTTYLNSNDPLAPAPAVAAPAPAAAPAAPALVAPGAAAPAAATTSVPCTLRVA
jgi:hypothetical protein